MTDPLIDWISIGKAVDQYVNNGYKHISLPWMVDKKYAYATCGDKNRSFETKGDKVLVGSAEQAFIQEDAEGRLPSGRYLAVTPCFRDEPVVDMYHQKSFIKVELYSNIGNLVEERDRMIDIARSVIMYSLAVKCPDVAMPSVVIDKTNDGFDITCAGIELGSYGIRSFEKTVWAYGTGLAEPRMSIVADQIHKEAMSKSKQYEIIGTI